MNPIGNWQDGGCIVNLYCAKEYIVKRVEDSITFSKLSSKFQIKDETKFKHMHNIVYHGKCHDKSCNSHYGGQTKCRIEKRVIQHNRTDINSHLLKHAHEFRHERVWLEDFKVLGSGYSSDFKRKISESLFINELKPDLNVQKTAFKLSLFN